MEDKNQTQPQTPSVTSPNTSPVVSPPAAMATPQASSENIPNTNNGKKPTKILLFVALGVFALIVLGAGGYLLFSNLQKNSSSSSADLPEGTVSKEECFTDDNYKSSTGYEVYNPDFVDKNMDKTYFGATVFFDSSNSEFSFSAEITNRDFEKMAVVYKTYPNKSYTFRITPKVKQESVNEFGEKLAEDRAKVVKDKLIEYGVPENKIVVAETNNSAIFSGESEQNTGIDIIADRPCQE